MDGIHGIRGWLLLEHLRQFPLCASGSQHRDNFTRSGHWNQPRQASWQAGTLTPMTSAEFDASPIRSPSELGSNEFHVDVADGAQRQRQCQRSDWRLVCLACLVGLHKPLDGWASISISISENLNPHFRISQLPPRQNSPAATFLPPSRRPRGRHTARPTTIFSMAEHDGRCIQPPRLHVK